MPGGAGTHHSQYFTEARRNYGCQESIVIYAFSMYKQTGKVHKRMIHSAPDNRVT